MKTEGLSKRRKAQTFFLFHRTSLHIGFVLLDKNNAGQYIAFKLTYTKVHIVLVYILDVVDCLEYI